MLFIFKMLFVYNYFWAIFLCLLCCNSRFKDQIHDVFKMLSADVQVILLSATMPDDVLEVSRCFMRNPVRILVQKEEVCNRNDCVFYISFTSLKSFYYSVIEIIWIEALPLAVYCSKLVADYMQMFNQMWNIDYFVKKLVKCKLDLCRKGSIPLSLHYKHKSQAHNLNITSLSVAVINIKH